MIKSTLTLMMNMIEDLFLELGDDEESDGEKNKRGQYQSPNLVDDNANPGRLRLR